MPHMYEYYDNLFVCTNNFITYFAESNSVNDFQKTAMLSTITNQYTAKISS